MLVEQFFELNLDNERRSLVQEANFTTISNSECKKYNWEKLVGEQNVTITDNMICAVNPKENGCHGDSGGPLITLGQNGTYQQIGIVSFGEVEGKNHCPVDLPNIFARVTSQLDWIKKMIKK